MFPSGLELFEHEARLHVAVGLVLARVFFDGAADLVVKDLADGDTWVDPNRVDCEHLQRPIATEAHVAEPGGDVDK